MSPRTGFSLSLLITSLAGGCATAVPPRNAEGPTAAIRAAEEVGADRVPTAALRLQLAREQLQRAKGMTSQSQQPAADRLLMRAQTDAELSLALARSSQARASANQAKEKAKAAQGAVK